MITKYTLTSSERSPGVVEWCCGVVTDNGGDKEWGPVLGRESALSILRGMVRDAFDEEWDESKLEEVNGGGAD